MRIISKNIIYFFFIILFFVSPFIFAQSIPYEKRFVDKDWGIRIGTSILYIGDQKFIQEDGELGYLDNSKYNLEGNSKLYSFSAEINYYVYDLIGIGLGAGWEYLNQPKLNYIPVYLNMILLPFQPINTVYLRGSYGYHLGNIRSSGAYVRYGIGYRFKVSNKVNAFVELTQSFQNLYKDYPDSERISNYYNLEGTGVSLLFELNN